MIILFFFLVFLISIQTFRNSFNEFKIRILKLVIIFLAHLHTIISKLPWTHENSILFLINCYFNLFVILLYTLRIFWWNNWRSKGFMFYIRWISKLYWREGWLNGWITSFAFRRIMWWKTIILDYIFKFVLFFNLDLFH